MEANVGTCVNNLNHRFQYIPLCIEHWPSRHFATQCTCHAKSGPGKKWTRDPILAEKKWTRGPLFSAKSGPSLPKVDLVQFCQEKSGPGPVSLSKSKQGHFWQGKKVDPVQFRCRNPGKSIFGRGKKCTRSSFAAEIQADPFLAGEKSGPSPVSLPKSRQVHFWQGEKVDPVQFRCRQVHFWQGEKVDPLPKSRQVHFWQGKKVDPLPKSRQVHFWQGKKVDPLPKSRQVHFWQGKKVDPLPKSRQVHFWQGKKVDPLPKSRQVHFWQGKKVDPLPKSRQVHFWQGKKVDPLPKSRQVHFWQGKKVDPLPKSRQVHFWQGKKVDPVQFRCRNPGRSIFGRGKKWTRSSFAAEIQAGPFLAGGKSGPGPVSLQAGPFLARGKSGPTAEIQVGPFLAREKSGPTAEIQAGPFWQGKKVDPVQFCC